MKIKICIFLVLLISADLALTVDLDKNERLFRNSKLTINYDQVKMTFEDDEVAFFAIGDWGGLPTYPYRTIIEETVSKEMTRLAQMHNTRFQLAIGDNFYFDGVKDLNDKRFQNTYANVFNSDELKGTPWFMALGNHDHYGNASAQVEYTNKSNNWILPNFNYSINVSIDNGKTNLIEILMLDTVLMCGNSGYDFELEPPKFLSLKDKIIGEDYFRSVERKLKQIGDSNVPYAIVAGHFPVWSIAEHGPTKCLVDRLRPLLHKYKVSAYFCGHDHNLQHISDTYLNQTVEYILSGASNFNDNSTDHISDIPPDSLKFHWGDGSLAHGGFTLIKASASNMTITYVESATSKELYQTVIFPRKS